MRYSEAGAQMDKLYARTYVSLRKCEWANLSMSVNVCLRIATSITTLL